jgi:hypothetical protein
VVATPPTGSDQELQRSATRTTTLLQRAAGAVRFVGNLVAATCESPETRLVVVGTSGLIASAITWWVRRR